MVTNSPRPDAFLSRGGLNGVAHMSVTVVAFFVFMLLLDISA